MLDMRSVNWSEPNKSLQALAMYDTSALSKVSTNCIPVAIVARYTGNQTYINYVNSQMQEISTWNLLQRPGWSLINPTDVLPTGGDGCWLATGYGIWDVLETIDIIGDLLDSTVKQNLKILLQREFNGIADDWNVKRPWPFKTGTANTNQWIVQFSGLAGATLYLEVAGI